MDDNFETRWSALKRALAVFARKLRRLRQEAAARRSFAKIAERKSRHLLDDIGMGGRDADCQRYLTRNDEKHRFWML